MKIEIKTLEASIVWDQEDRAYTAVALLFGGYEVVRWEIPKARQHYFDAPGIEEEVAQFVAEKLKELPWSQ